jgi:hypothetical protein
MPPPPCQGRTERQPDPEPDDQPGDTAQGRPFESPQARLDEVGKPIPDYLWEKWDRGAQMKEMASTISRVVGVIRRLHDNGDHLLLDENGQAIIAALETAGHGLKSNVPFAVCPYCNGILADRCRTCRGRGIIGKYRYENTVPREMRP